MCSPNSPVIKISDPEWGSKNNPKRTNQRSSFSTIFLGNEEKKKSAETMDASSTKTDISVVVAATVRASTTRPEEEISSSRGLQLFSSRHRRAFYPTTVAIFSSAFSLSLSLSFSFFFFAHFAFSQTTARIAVCIQFAATNSRFHYKMPIRLHYFVVILIFAVY